jgi:Ser/Thr protein kinase RdoA (MazF antagonist)
MLTLVVMAAGLGSRYGGLKQVDPVGTGGELILDYTVFDARLAGFEKVIFIINDAIEDELRSHVERTFKSQFEVVYVHQRLDDLPKGVEVPPARKKPWGTGQAVLCCRNLIDGPFAVVNADDFYGRDSLIRVGDFLFNLPDPVNSHEYCMAGFQIENTLTPQGSVARGVCEIDGHGYLKEIRERTRIERRGGDIQYFDPGGDWIKIRPGCVVSMNLWGFTPSIFPVLEDRFVAFLNGESEDLNQVEYYLPEVVNSLLQEQAATVRVLDTEAQWLGISYHADKEWVGNSISALIGEGLYPEKLWSEWMKIDFESIVDRFNFSGDFLAATPFGRGHINDTFATHHRVNGKNSRYILQRVNTNVFRDPERLMENIEAVTNHQRKKIIAAGGDTERETLNLIPTLEGGSYIRTEAGDYWRAYVFIENARTYEQVETLDHVFNAGKAFGKFQRLLQDFPAAQLFETIPNFHNTRERFSAFEDSVVRNEVGLAKSCRPEIDFVIARREKASIFIDLIDRGEIKLRIAHNDTKFNNVMIDDHTGEGICVIDLDTVMPGLSVYDFGDSIRSLANTAAEDEQDLSKVHFNMQIYREFTRGYLDSARSFLSAREIEYLPMGAIIMTFECGMRFLADYLDGDVYFKVHRPRHNLDRCRTQFKLVEEMEARYGEMVEVVRELA